MNFLDLFAGIGGFRLGMERAGHKCVGFCEIDKFARSSYKAMHNTKNEIEYHDINEVTNEEFRKLRGKVDVICGGFPCQAFSIAGKQLGFEDARGTLFYEIARATKEIKPRYLLLENVRNLLSHDKGQTFTRILKILDELGYDAEWQVLNSKNFGVPQNRERVFIVGHLRGGCTYKVFPIRDNTKQINELPRKRITTNTLTARYTATGNGSYVIENKQKKVALVSVDFNLKIVFRSGRELKLVVSGVELDWLFDTCFARSESHFQNLGDREVINTNEIEYFVYEEVETDEL